MAGLWHLTEDDVALWPIQGPPLPYPPLQSAPYAVVGEGQGVQTLKMAQQGDGLKGTVLLKQRKQVGFPISFKRVCYGAPMRDVAVGRQCRIGVKTPGSAFAEPGTGGCGSLTMGLKV